MVIGFALLLPSISYLPSHICLYAAELDEEKQKEKEEEKAWKEREKEAEQLEKERIKEEEKRQKEEERRIQEEQKKEKNLRKEQVNRQKQLDEKRKKEAKRLQKLQEMEEKKKLSDEQKTEKAKQKEEEKVKIIEGEEIQRQKDKEKELGIDLGDEEIYLRQGIRLYKIGNYKAAMDKFVKVLSLNPYNKKARKYLKKTSEILSGLKSEGHISETFRDKIVRNSQQILKYQGIAKQKEQLIYSEIIRNAKKSIKAEEGKILSPVSIRKITKNVKETLVLEKKISKE